MLLYARIFTDSVIVLTLVTLAAQLAGVYLYRSRSARLMRIPRNA